MRRKFDSWWDALSPGEKVFWPICALNTAVWFAWRIPTWAPSMVSYFSATPVSSKFYVYIEELVESRNMYISKHVLRTGG